MKETFYFSHDYNAQSDEKILKLRRELGLEGYGIYWCLIEKLASAEGRLSLSSIGDIAYDLHISEEKVFQIIQNYNLFIIDENEEIFFNERLLNHFDKRNIIKEKKAEAGRKGMEKRWGKKKETITDVITKDNTTIEKDNTTITKNNKGKESKGKENKVKEIVISKPTKVKTFEEGDFEYDMASKFMDFHIKKGTKSILYLEKTKGREVIIKKWAITVGDLQRLDGFPKEIIEKVFRFTVAEPFWTKQILSIEKFRKKKDGISYFLKMIDLMDNENNRLSNNKTIGVL